MESILRENNFKYSVSGKLYYSTFESKSITKICNKNYSSIRCFRHFEHSKIVKYIPEEPLSMYFL